MDSYSSDSNSGAQASTRRPAAVMKPTHQPCGIGTPLSDSCSSGAKLPSAMRAATSSWRSAMADSMAAASSSLAKAGGPSSPQTMGSHSSMAA